MESSQGLEEVEQIELKKPSAIKKLILESQKAKDNLPFAIYKPYDEKVILSEILEDISNTVLKFLIISKEQADTAALWVVHTYTVCIFNNSPIFIINAPERACAKTLFQSLIAEISFKPLSASNITASALFRSVELWSPTIFIDEADTFFKENSELKGMVNAGYSKKNGFVIKSETVGDTFMPRKYSVYSAKSIAGIALEKHLPDATLSRGIMIKMRRKLPNETVTRIRDAEPDLFKNISTKLLRVAIDYCDEIHAARPEMPDALSDRAQDNWEPLLTIAKCAGDGWFERTTTAALSLSSSVDESVSTGNELLSDIQQVFEQQDSNNQYAGKISTSGLIQALISVEDGPWKTYNNGHPISPRQLSKQLQYYGIKSKTVRMGFSDTPKGYSIDQFEDAFARYLTVAKPAENDTDVDSIENEIGSNESTKLEDDF